MKNVCIVQQVLRFWMGRVESGRAIDGIDLHNVYARMCTFHDESSNGGAFCRRYPTISDDIDVAYRYVSDVNGGDTSTIAMEIADGVVNVILFEIVLGSNEQQRGRLPFFPFSLAQSY